jgi:hypothetical protein
VRVTLAPSCAGFTRASIFFAKQGLGVSDGLRHWLGSGSFCQDQTACCAVRLEILFSLPFPPLASFWQNAENDCSRIFAHASIDKFGHDGMIVSARVRFAKIRRHVPLFILKHCFHYLFPRWLRLRKMLKMIAAG